MAIEITKEDDEKLNFFFKNIKIFRYIYINAKNGIIFFYIFIFSFE